MDSGKIDAGGRLATELGRGESLQTLMSAKKQAGGVDLGYSRPNIEVSAGDAQASATIAAMKIVPLISQKPVPTYNPGLNNAVNDALYYTYDYVYGRNQAPAPAPGS